MSRDSNTILLRQQYTGEPRQAAQAFYQARGLYFGLVPDATDPQQQLLEAVVMLSLARPRLPEPAETASRFGLRGVSPDVDQLVLWPDPDHLPQLLARILPTRTSAGIGGVAGLRVRPPAGRTDTLLLARPGNRAHLTVRARRRDLAAAEQWAKDTGLEPLWTARTAQADEHEAWRYLVEGMPPEERAVWSRALRRIALQPTGSRDWAERLPTRQELDGPKPQRIEARPVGPAGGPARGVIAVTTSRGQAGLGCTTAALALAAALAHTGTRVAFLGTGAEDPNGLAYLLRDDLPPAGVFTDLADDLPGCGALRAMTLPPDAARARDLLSQASRTHDTVVLDAGAVFQMRHLVEHADAVIALAPYQPAVWGHTEDTAQLLQFLDTRFAAYVEARTETEDFYDAEHPDVYFAEDRSNYADRWWAEFENAPHASDDWPRLPDESATAHLRAWRRDFINFLDREGRRRHPTTWSAVAAVWADRNRARNARGLQPDEDANDLSAYLGEHDIKSVRHLADPAPVTAWLLRQFDSLVETGPTLLLPRVPEDVDQHQLAEVREGLRAHGIPDIVTWPELDELRELPFIIAGVTSMSDEAAAAANHLALAAADCLAARKGATV
ncbi:hypothetical protein OG883_43990 [Streptomyces sp. NBC_01142]|uniref:hypothetical protein n=1 Tax=Streptomyces sp. NBC_01142 TaxID=2975865 RepID=UPI0022590760|nr:hypothetical protein [Streptomyces sp. NBC_01142]MCX4826604.1 hypothetical protein [Streptomyces sp. NBC_01142]